MAIELQYCHVTVNDVDESLGFYRDALGLEVRNDVGTGSFRWVTLGSPGQPVPEVVLSEPHAGRSEADGDAMQELLTKGVLPITGFRVDNQKVNGYECSYIYNSPTSQRCKPNSLYPWCG